MPALPNRLQSSFDYVGIKMLVKWSSIL